MGSEPSTREVTLVLCSAAGEVFGALPSFQAPVPYWQEAGPVVDAARATHGIEVTVLRVLAAPAGTDPVGGTVTYLAEVPRRPGILLSDWAGDPCAPEPLRQTWAEPGGPAEHLRWADEQLATLGVVRGGPAEQVKSWNLSGLWRLPLAAEPEDATAAVWLKVVPPFFGHEGAVLARLDPAAVPSLIAYDGPRALLGEVGGEDGYFSTGQTLLRMVDLLVGLQAAWVGRTDELLQVGAADFRSPALSTAAQDTYERTADELDQPTRQVLEAGLRGLPDRFAALEACGVPDTLVHGDFHPGNLLVRDGARADGGSVVLLDWGDCGVGHPLLDQAAFTGRLGPEDLAAVRSHWADLWRAAVPGCAPERAAALLSPVAALRQAVVYRMFLDRIEPDERVYHVTDPGRWLAEAARRFAQERFATETTET